MKISLLAVVVLTITNLSVFAETNSASTSSSIGTEGREITGQERDEFLAKFGGIGIAIAPSADGVLVKKVLPDTPACAAGMKAGDIVTQINSKSTKGLKVQEMVDQMRGAVGTEVELLVSRQGQTVPIKLKLVRREIPIHKGDVSCE